MNALQTLVRVRRRGVTLVPVGDRLRFSPASALTPELVNELRENKASILDILARQDEARQDTSPRIGSVAAVLEIACEILGLVEDPVTPPASPGRDPLAKRNTDKARFFCDDWRRA